MLTLPATLTIEEAHDTLRALSDGIREATEQTVLIDAAALTQLDTSAVATLLECRRTAQAVGRRIELRNAPARLCSLANLYGVADLIAMRAPDAGANPVAAA